MPQILALHLELANFVLPPNSIPQRQRSLQSRDSKICAGFLLGKSFCSFCQVACPPFPPRLLARSNDVTYVQVGSIVLWAVVFPGGSCDSSRNTIIVYV